MGVSGSSLEIWEGKTSPRAFYKALALSEKAPRVQSPGETNLKRTVSRPGHEK